MQPVLFVADVTRALGFYVDTLGFEKRWHEADGAGGVCQVTRGECEIILCEDATRRDRGRLFVELTPEDQPGFPEAVRALEQVFPTMLAWSHKVVQPAFATNEVIRARCTLRGPGSVLPWQPRRSPEVRLVPSGRRALQLMRRAVRPLGHARVVN
jgi:catechol 2,3-dioxygenase-like lactoylglutathione lyase family enzyme